MTATSIIEHRISDKASMTNSGEWGSRRGSIMSDSTRRVVTSENNVLPITGFTVSPLALIAKVSS